MVKNLFSHNNDYILYFIYRKNYIDFYYVKFTKKLIIRKIKKYKLKIKIIFFILIYNFYN